MDSKYGKAGQYTYQHAGKLFWLQDYGIQSTIVQDYVKCSQH